MRAGRRPLAAPAQRLAPVGCRRGRPRRTPPSSEAPPRRPPSSPAPGRWASSRHPQHVAWDECATQRRFDKLLVKAASGCHDGFMRSLCARGFGVLLVSILVVVLGGCVGGGHALGTPGSQPIPVGQSTQSIDSGGVSRTFHLYRPQGLPDAAPLVVMLHGGFGNGAQAE